MMDRQQAIDLIATKIMGWRKELITMEKMKTWRWLNSDGDQLGPCEWNWNPFTNPDYWYQLDCKLVDLGYQTEHLHLHSGCKSKIGERGCRISDGSGSTIMESGSLAALQLIEFQASREDKEGVPA